MPSLRRLWRLASPARIPNWEREEGKATSRAPGLVPSLRHDPMMLLSQPVPDGEDSSIRLASSSTTHSTTRPVLRAFMAEIVANAILGVSLVVKLSMFYVLCLPLRVHTLYIYLKFHRVLHRASRPSCVSRVAFSHNHSFCWSCNDQILASVL